MPIPHRMAHVMRSPPAATTLLSCSAVALIACSGAPTGPAPESSGSTSPPDSIKLTQLVVNADGTTTRQVDYVSQARWSALLAAKQRATAAHAAGRPIETVEDLTLAGGSSCLPSDLYLYFDADAAGGPPDLCVRGTGNWEAYPPGCSWLCFGFNGFWPGDTNGAFYWGDTRRCDNAQNFWAWGPAENTSAPNPAWVTLLGDCQV